MRLKIQPREFRFRAGARTELDRIFIQIINNLSPETNLSEFIKWSVVENHHHQNQLTEIDKLRLEFNEFVSGLQNFRMKLQAIEDKPGVDSEALKLLKTELKKLIDEEVLQR